MDQRLPTLVESDYVLVRVHLFLRLVCHHANMKIMRPSQMLLDDSEGHVPKPELSAYLPPQSNAQDMSEQGKTQQLRALAIWASEMVDVLGYHPACS